MNPTLLIENNSRDRVWNYYYYMLITAGFSAGEAIDYMNLRREWFNI